MFAVLLLVLISGVYASVPGNEPGDEWCLKNPYPFTNPIEKVRHDIKAGKVAIPCNETAANEAMSNLTHAEVEFDNVMSEFKKEFDRQWAEAKK